VVRDLTVYHPLRWSHGEHGERIKGCLSQRVEHKMASMPVFDTNASVRVAQRRKERLKERVCVPVKTGIHMMRMVQGGSLNSSAPGRVIFILIHILHSATPEVVYKLYRFATRFAGGAKLMEASGQLMEPSVQYKMPSVEQKMASV